MSGSELNGGNTHGANERDVPPWTVEFGQIPGNATYQRSEIDRFAAQPQPSRKFESTEVQPRDWGWTA